MGEMIEKRKTFRASVEEADKVIQNIAQKHGSSFQHLCALEDYPAIVEGDNPDGLRVSATKLAALLTTIHYSA